MDSNHDGTSRPRMARRGTARTGVPASDHSVEDGWRPEPDEDLNAELDLVAWLRHKLTPPTSVPGNRFCNG